MTITRLSCDGNGDILPSPTGGLTWYDDAKALQDERDELRAENERLRADIHRHLTSQAYLDIKSENERLREQVKQWRYEHDRAATERSELRASLDNRKADVRGWEDKFTEVASLAGWSSPSDGTPADAIRRAIAERNELRASLADAMRRGFDIAVEHADISTHDGWHVTSPRIEWDASEKALKAALASLPASECSK